MALFQRLQGHCYVFLDKITFIWVFGPNTNWNNDQGWAFLGADTKDVPPTGFSGAPVEFTVQWVPPKDIPWFSHFCVKAEIQPYQDPGNPLILDNNFFNNIARSNYCVTISASSSSHSRTGSQIYLGNPFSAAAIVTAVVKKTHSHHRTFTSHRYLRVGAKESKPIMVWDEAINSAADFPDFDRNYMHKYPNMISVTGYVNSPYPADCLTPVKTGGVGLKVLVRRATKVTVQELSQFNVGGKVSYVDTGNAVAGTGGRLLVELMPARETAIGEEMIISTDVNSDGRFAAKFDIGFPNRPRLLGVAVYYLGSGDAAPAESKQIIN